MSLGVLGAVDSGVLATVWTRPRQRFWMKKRLWLTKNPKELKTIVVVASEVVDVVIAEVRAALQKIITCNN